MNQNQNESDVVIEEIREIRRKIWQRFDNDPKRVVAHFMELQKKHKDRMVDTEKPQSDSDPSAA